MDQVNLLDLPFVQITGDLRLKSRRPCIMLTGSSSYLPCSNTGQYFFAPLPRIIADATATILLDLHEDAPGSVIPKAYV